jgi:hypothetical protein
MRLNPPIEEAIHKRLTDRNKCCVDPAGTPSLFLNTVNAAIGVSSQSAFLKTQPEVSRFVLRKRRRRQ